MTEPKLTELQRELLLYVDEYGFHSELGGSTIGELWSRGLVKAHFTITPAGRKLAETLRKENDDE